jgi:DNA-binding transcriptional LysR family regulator
MSCYPCAVDGLDLNLLATLDVLLSEGSVVGAARRLQLSPSAMSRALARLRTATGDRLLVRAGRGLVPTPRALELKGRVRQVVDAAEAVLRPALKLELATLSRTFNLRCTEGFVETFGAALVARVQADAPSVRLSFFAKPDKDSTPLRDGSIDLETGVVAGTMGPELRVLGLFRDRFVGVVRPGHPLLDGTMTPQRYAAARHVAVERRGLRTAMVDEALERTGLARDIAATVSGFGAAVALARASDLVATVPEHHDAGLCVGMRTFALPMPTDAFTISLIWHPRMDADPAHRWFRGVVLDTCKRASS